MGNIVKKKIISLAAGVILIAVVAGGTYFYMNRDKEEDAVSIKASAGQEIRYATINQINGNDIEVTILNEEMVERITAVSETTGEQAEPAIRGNRSKDEGKEMPKMPDMSRGGMPDMSGGGMPDMSGGGMPDMPENGMTGGSEDGDRSEQKPDQKEKQSETASYRIPVGTDVITKLGATTTFSHLEDGDTIAILLEEGTDIILKVWMVM